MERLYLDYSTGETNLSHLPPGIADILLRPLPTVPLCRSLHHEEVDEEATCLSLTERLGKERYDILLQHYSLTELLNLTPIENMMQIADQLLANEPSTQKSLKRGIDESRVEEPVYMEQ